MTDALPSQRCTQGHVMRLRERFRFDHEPGDTERVSALLDRFRAAGLELGAEVALYVCPTCDEATAAFHYGPPGGAASA